MTGMQSNLFGLKVVTLQQRWTSGLLHFILTIFFLKTEPVCCSNRFRDLFLTEINDKQLYVLFIHDFVMSKDIPICTINNYIIGYSNFLSITMFSVHYFSGLIKNNITKTKYKRLQHKQYSKEI